MSSSFYLGHTPFRVRWLDASGLSPVASGSMNKLLVIGGYHEVHVLWLGAVNMQADTESEPSVSIHCDQELCHDGGFNDLQVAHIPGISVDLKKVVLTASSKGSVSRVPVRVDTQGGTAVLTDDSTTEVLKPWLHMSSGAVTSVDVWEAQTVLAVGEDGAIATAPLEGDSSQADMWKTPSSTCSYSQGRWTGSTSFITAGTAGGLQCWDTRSGPSPVSRSPLTWGPSGLKGERAGEIFALQVHPSRPNVCATGGSNGAVVLWDLRFDKQPVTAAYGGPEAGPVWEVAFDEAGAFSNGSSTPIVYCTESGQLLRTSSDASPAAANLQPTGLSSVPPPEALLTGYGAINSFDVEPTHGRDVVAATDTGALLYVQRPERLL